MNENLDPTSQRLSSEELDIERALRPLSFDDFAGQDAVLENLQVFVKAANLRGEALDHIPFFMGLQVLVKLLLLIFYLMNWE